MSGAFTDRWGSPVVAGGPHVLALLEDAIEQLVSLSGDPAGLADEAVARDPSLVLARVLQAYLALYSTAASGFERARSLVGDLDPHLVLAGERERVHVRAVRAWADGELEQAASALELALLHDPRDLLALRVAQDLYFYLGNQQDLRDVIERVLSAWPEDQPGYGYVSGMYAFGLEENGQYEAAGEWARIALAANPRDVWAVHAQAHIFEMQGPQPLGVAFLDHTVDDWSSSFFAIHNWWHRALYHLELRQLDEVLRIYDGPIRAARSSEWLDVVDAASLLWRLHLFGVDVGERATTLLGDIDGQLDEPVFVFNDWHALMSAGLAGSREVSERLILVNRSAPGGTNRRAIDAAGLDLLEGFDAFARGDMNGALHRLVDVRPRTHVVGGSHAQRDVIELTVIAAAARAGDVTLADAILAERVERKPSAKAAGLELIRTNRRR